ncbi:PAS domain S-box protein, partial [candidate division KSB1 bacterium]|nr:PAS domain S-box protein [candidate division KSB1 bacterium]
MKSSNKSNSNRKRSSSKTNTGSKKRISVPDLDANHKLKEEKSKEELKRMVKKPTYELVQSKKYFADIIQMAGDAIISIDEKYIILLFNSEAENIFGYKAKEVIGKSISIIIPDRFVKDHNQHIKSFKNSKVISKKMGERIQVFGIKKDGTEFSAEASISKLIKKDNIVFTVIVRDITQRILAERKLKDIASDLQASQQMLQIVMDTIPVRVFWKNLNLDYLGCNKLFAKDAGLNSPEEIVGKNDFQLTWKEHAELYRANDSQVIDSGKSKLNYEELITTADGNKILLNQSKVPLINQNGKLIGVLGTYEDVTELKKVEEEKEKLAWIVEANTDFIGLADLNGQMLYINKAGKKLVGINSNEEIESMNIVEFYSKNDQITLMEEILPDLMEKGNWKGEYQLRHFKTGKSIPVEMVAFRIDDTKTGQPLAIANISRDITERKKVERDKERVGLELRQFIETANAPIFGIDVDGKINEWNEKAERIFGYTKDDVMGRDLVKEFITDDYKESVKSVLDDALKGKETSNYEIPLYTKKDERRVLILLNATTRRDIEGKITGVMGVGQDITELDEYRKNLEQKVEDRTIELRRSIADTEESRDRIDGILKSIGDSLIVTDMHNRVILMNRAAEDLLDVRFSEVI